MNSNVNSTSATKGVEINVIYLLETVLKKWWLLVVSAVVMAEQPKLSPYREVITENLAKALGLNKDAVGITFTTLEGIGIVGREEGIASQAFVLTKEI